MANNLFSGFSSIQNLNRPVTQDLVKDLVEYCSMFESRGGLALNSPFLGVYPIYFTTTDREILFRLLEVEESQIEEIISSVPSIDPNWNVVRDPYNHLIIWMCHKFFTSQLPKDKKDLAMVTLLKMLHYKFFTSLVYNSYKHGADPNVMESVINNLSNKYDIVQYKTWKGVIEARCQDVISPSSIHLDVFKNYDGDDKIIYILSDIQSRIRQKIRLISNLYYDAKEEGGAGIGTYSSTDTIDGEKVILSQSNIFDLMIEGMIVQVQTTARFLDNELIKALCKKFQYISEEMLRGVLTMMTETAAIQAESGDMFTQKKIKGDIVYTGMGLIVRELIQKTYRICILDKINLNSKASILIKTMNLYTSSRVTDEDILTLKRSILYFVVGCKKSSREATNSSLVIAVILYTIIRSFDYIK